MKKSKGFTLVELLAVIVILAIIMIIAIPSVLDTVNKANRKTFDEFAQKVFLLGQEQFELLDLFNNTDAIADHPGYDVYVYAFDVRNDLGMDSTGDFDGVLGIICSYGDWGVGPLEFKEGDIDYNLHLINNSLYGSYYFTVDEIPNSYSDVPEIYKRSAKEGTLKQFYAEHFKDVFNFSGDVLVIDGKTNNVLYEYH